MYSGIKPGIACVQCESTKTVERTGRESKIVPGMIRQGSDISESGGQSFCSSCRNVGMGSGIFRMIGGCKLSGPGSIADDIVDVGDRPDIKVYVFVVEHTDHGIVQAYSGKSISAGSFVEATVRLSDGLLGNAHPVTGGRNAGHISPEQSHILLVCCQHFGCLVEVIDLVIKIRSGSFRIWYGCP